jgi:uncharacterized OB-fold protein
MDETSFEEALASSRILPELTERNRTFWMAGREGKLMLQRCASCRRFTSPPAGSCPSCGGELAYEQVSGRGRVFSFTITHQPYNPAVPVPYVVALVELDDQEGLRLFTNLIAIEPADVRIGLEVEVRFEDHGEIFVPVFAPLA